MSCVVCDPYDCVCGAATPTPTEQKPSRCDGDWTNNCWIEKESPEAMGVCLLDTLCDEQIIDILSRNDQARDDLVKITTDPHLHDLLAKTPRLPEGNFGDTLQSEVNDDKGSIPFYAAFRGQPPFAQ